ncbi:MAG: aminopeptidase P family protein [Chitinophagaceae bacterium]
MFHKSVYSARRAKLKNAVGNGLILLLGNEESSMNYKDNVYPFRQASTFLYFFGIDRPGVMAIMDLDNDKETLFGDDVTVEQMIWTGFREPLELLSDQFGISQVKEKKEFAPTVKRARSEKRNIHFLPPYRLEHVDALSSLLDVSPGVLQNMISVKLVKAVITQRSIKSIEEVAEITKAVNTTNEMQLAAINMAGEGMTEAEIAGKIHGIAIAAGGNLSFPTILTINGQILHNGYSQSVLRQGNLVLCDCGAETAMHYAGDLTRTFPVGKTFTTLQKDIYTIVLEAHQAAAGMLKPGVLFRDVHLFACEKLTRGLQQLGLMKGDSKESVAVGAHALFFPCGVGHMMGLDTHDMENLGEKYVGYNDEITQSSQFGLKSLRLGKDLETGFVLTVEPGLYFNADLIDAWQAEKKFSAFINYDKLKDYRSFSGVRVEEDFLITSQGSIVLGEPLAKTLQEIEDCRK